MTRNSHGKPAFFCKKESLAKKMNCRAAPMSRLDRRFFGKKARQKTQWSNIRVNVSFTGKLGKESEPSLRSDVAA